MGNRGRFGKYGETKRINRLRNAKFTHPSPHESDLKPPKQRHLFKKSIYQMTPIKTRPAKESDLSFIGRLSGKVFDIYGPYEELVSRWFESGITTTIIAGMDKKPVGFAMIGDLSNRYNQVYVSELLAIAVEPEKQGMGIGEILIRDIERKAVELNIKMLFLHTAVKNLSARKLFTKNGYRPWEIKRGFYPEGQDAVVMSKEITELGPTKE